MLTLTLIGGAFAASRPTGWGRPDMDAACLAAGVRVGLAVQQAHGAAFDGWITALLPWSDTLPLPDLCAGHVEVWVASLTPGSATVCARVTTGGGRNACAEVGSGAFESTIPQLDPPVEGAATAGEHPETVIASVAAGVDVTAPPHRVFVRGTDGRVLRDLDTDEVAACARRALQDLRMAELSFDAAFDLWSADVDTLGYRINGRGDDCDAWVAVRVSDASPGALRMESVILEGELSGHGGWMGVDGAWHEAGLVPAARAWLAAEGWLLVAGVDWSGRGG